MKSNRLWIALALVGLTAGGAAQVGPSVQPTTGNMDKVGRLEPTVGDAGFAMCFGDGTGALCANRHQGDLGRGCENAQRTGGARLVASGFPSISNDSVAFHVDGLTFGTTAVYLQAATPARGGYGTPFGDGINCLSGATLRLGAKPSFDGFSLFPDQFDPALSVVGHVSVLEPVLYYQVMYRDNTRNGTNNTFNLTNAWRIQWIP